MEKPVKETKDSTLEERLSNIESRLEKLEGVTKIEKIPLQVVIERNGDKITAKRKVLIKTATEQKEDWEDVTGKYTTQELEDKLNGLES